MQIELTSIQTGVTSDSQNQVWEKNQSQSQQHVAAIEETVKSKLTQSDRDKETVVTLTLRTSVG